MRDQDGVAAHVPEHVRGVRDDVTGLVTVTK
jgi:hypothetical protein